jgi:hypothetical protein
MPFALKYGEDDEPTTVIPIYKKSIIYNGLATG